MTGVTSSLLDAAYLREWWGGFWIEREIGVLEFIVSAAPAAARVTTYAYACACAYAAAYA